MMIWVWWPISLYSGWIAVAAIANVAAYLSKIGWQALFSEVTWTVIMIVVAGISESRDDPKTEYAVICISRYLGFYSYSCETLG